MAVIPEVLLEAAAAMGDGNQEVDWRNAASRSYYAAYHRCILLSYGHASAEPGHGELIYRFTRAAEVRDRQIGHLLQQCKRLRERADYRIVADFELSESQTALRAVRRIFELAESASPPNERV